MELANDDWKQSDASTLNQEYNIQIASQNKVARIRAKHELTISDDSK